MFVGRRGDEGRRSTLRNLDTRLDLERMGEHVLEIRLRQGDLTLAALNRELRARRKSSPNQTMDGH